MQNFGLQNIKWESVKSIYSIIAGETSVSRAAISAKTGLSLMTVGKVTEALLSMGIILQTKETKTAAGRRPGLLRVNPAHYAIVLDLTSQEFSYSLIDMHLEMVEKHMHVYNDDFFFEENFVRFLKDIASYLTHRGDLAACVGIGVSLPGAYDAATDRLVGERLPGLSSIPVAETIEKYLGEFPLHIDADVNAAAMSNVLQIENYRKKQIQYWFVNAGNISGAIVYHGELLRGAHNAAGSYGNIQPIRGRTLSSMLRLNNTPAENASLLAGAIYNSMIVSDPDHIVIECELYHHRDEFIDLVRTHLSKNYTLSEDAVSLIAGSECAFRHAHRGLAMKLREMWLARLILSDPIN